jgi:hypothetical protein
MDFLDHIAEALNDKANTVWPREVLREYVANAASAILSRTHSGAETKTIPLEDSTAHDESFVMCSATAVTDIHGNEIHPVLMGKPGRNSCGAYFCVCAGHSAHITPHLDYNKPYYLRVVGIDLTNPPQQYRQALMEWALYRAHSVDAESSGVVSAIAKTHVVTWEAALKKIDIRFLQRSR